MKKIYLFSLFCIGSFSIQAQDDVYDAPEPKRVIIYADPQQDESNYDPYDNYDYDYNGYNSQNLGYSNKLKRMFSNQPCNNMSMNPYTFCNPYSFGMGFNNFYNPYSFYNPYGYNYNSYYNPYSTFYAPYGYPYYNYGYYNLYNSYGLGTNNFIPRPQTPRRETPRGFGRLDDTYRPSPAKTQPSNNNVGFGAVPSNSSRESNRYSSPSFEPSFPSGNSNNNNKSGIGGSNMNSQPASPPSNGNNRGRTGRF